MSEQILRIQLRELGTIRLRRPDGTVVEMPLDRLTDYAVRNSHEFQPVAARCLKELGMLLKELLSKEAGIEVEFVISDPVSPSPAKPAGPASRSR